MSASKKGYLLIFLGTDGYQVLSPERKQQIPDNWVAWLKRLKDEGKSAGGNPLEREGKIVSGQRRVVPNGPFAESNESIGGYFLLPVTSMDEAVAIAQQCPGLPHGTRVEVRPIAGECPMTMEARAGTQIAHA